MTPPENTPNLPSSDTEGPARELTGLSKAEKEIFFEQIMYERQAMGDAVEAFETSGMEIISLIHKQYDTKISPREAKEGVEALNKKVASHSRLYANIFTAFLDENSASDRTYDPDEAAQVLAPIMYADFRERDQACMSLSGTDEVPFTMDGMRESLQRMCRNLTYQDDDTEIEDVDIAHIDTRVTTDLIFNSMAQIISVEIQRLIENSPKNFSDYKGIDWKKVSSNLGKYAGMAAIGALAGLVASYRVAPPKKKSPRRR